MVYLSGTAWQISAILKKVKLFSSGYIGQQVGQRSKPKAAEMCMCNMKTNMVFQDLLRKRRSGQMASRTFKATPQPPPRQMANQRDGRLIRDA